MMQEIQQRPAIAVPRTEHISLETNADDGLLATSVQRRRKVRMSYALRSKLRGCETEVSLLEEHFLSVHSVRPDTQPMKYELDLRFANAKPVLVRHVAWFWLALAVGFTLLACGALWSLWPIAAADLINPIPLTAIAALLAAAGAALMFLRRTTESLEFTSVHGGVTLVSVTGGIGSARDGRKFFVELIKSINAAKTTRQHQRAQFLRDEMREHTRLRELGVLTQEQYEMSKGRILGSH
jgi:hypothetical protein